MFRTIVVPLSSGVNIKNNFLDCFKFYYLKLEVYKVLILTLYRMSIKFYVHRARDCCHGFVDAIFNRFQQTKITLNGEAWVNIHLRSDWLNLSLFNAE